MPLYPFCSHCVATRVCTYVETPVPPWPVDEAGFSDVPYAAWDPNLGNTKVRIAGGWGRITGANGVATMGMLASVSTPVLENIEWRFTARSSHARDIKSLVGIYWQDLKAIPDLTFYPEARRYHLSFISLSTTAEALRLTSDQGPLKENFELAEDMQYRVVI